MSQQTDNYGMDTLRYIIGVGLAAVFTLVAYGLAALGWFGLSVGMIALYILLLAATQLIVQVVFFLHIGDESGTKWKTITFVFTVMMMLVVVIGSLWIMQNLQYHMKMTPEQINEYMVEQNGKGF